jgi:hypothetical protein
MGRQAIPEWARVLRKVAARLTSGVQEIFGSTEAVLFTPPDSTPHHESAPTDDHPHAVAHSAGKADQLPPREQRGRD